MILPFSNGVQQLTGLGWAWQWTALGGEIAPVGDDGQVCGEIRAVPSVLGSFVIGPSVVGRVVVVPSVIGTVKAGC